MLLENGPEYLFWLGGAALSGATIVGINPTRRGAELARDIRHTDCQLIVTESLDALAEVMIGAPGNTPSGVTGVDGTDSGPVPSELAALTVKVKGASRSKPVTTVDVTDAPTTEVVTASPST